MKDPVLLSIAALLQLEIFAQWIALQFRFPAILLLWQGLLIILRLLINLNQVMGTILYPFISLSVAIILFEGGLSLRIADLKFVGKPIQNLI